MLLGVVAAIMPIALAADEGGVPIRVVLEQPGYVTLVIEGADGRRVRNLVSGTPLPAGESTLWWDGTDDTERLQTTPGGTYAVVHRTVPPGQYRVRGLWRPEIDLRYEFTLYNPGQPPWANGEPTSEWLANHSAPSGMLFVPEDDARLGPSGESPGGIVLVSSYVTEGGSGVAWLDLEGRKRYGQHWIGGVWTGASHLARDAGPERVPGVYAYAGAAWAAGAGGGFDGPRSELRLAELLLKDAKGGAPRDGRFGAGFDRPLLAPSAPYQGLLPNGVESLAREGEDTRYAFPDAERCALSGLAVHNARLVAALPKMNELLWVDARARSILGTTPLADPRGLAFDRDGRLLALSGRRLLRFAPDPAALELGMPEVLVDGDLEDPWGIAVADDGRIYVSDRGGSHQVKLFDADGRLRMAIGHPGGPSLGGYDPLRMHNPDGLAIDSRGRLWVTETDFTPKRLSVWRADGTLERAFYGPMEYGGGGALDGDDPATFRYNGLEFAVDWANGESVPRATYYLPSADPLSLATPFRSRAPEASIRLDGRTYLTDCYNVSPTNAAESASLWLLGDGVARPVAAIGSANEWPRLAGLFPRNAEWSVRWTGQIEAPASGEYSFTTVSDDGVRLSVDGQRLVDNWTPHGTTEDSGTIALEAGKRYDIALEFYQGVGGATIRLLWTPPGGAREVVPERVLLPTADAAPGGLTGEYFARPDLTEPRGRRIDAQISFAWDAAPPEPLLPTASAEYAARVPPGTTPGDRLAFAWSDLDDDGQVQPEEVVFVRGDAYGVTLAPDLSFLVAYLDGRAMRFRPVGFTPGGAPRYDLGAGEVLVEGARKPNTSGGGQALVSDDGWTLLTVPPEPYAAQASIAGVREGIAMWSYPSCWPGLHPSHEAPMPSAPGQLLGTTRLLGGLVTPRGSDLGPVCAINGNKGNVYLLTIDGLFVATLFRDCRTASWNAPRAERGMLANELSQNEECFWPTISQLQPDGRIVLTTGGAGGSIVSVEGLERARRLPEQDVSVTAEDLARAEEARLAREAERRRSEGPKVLTVWRPEVAPTLDGSTEEWPAESFVTIDDHATAALAIAGDRLLAAFRTGDGGLPSNAAESLPLLFKSGGALDVQLEPVDGGVRLLVSRVRGTPTAVLYRPVDPLATAAPTPFTSPLRTLLFDTVRDVTADLQFAEDGRGGFELSVPLETLCLGSTPRVTIRGDIGVLRGNGFRTLQRSYWANESAGVTSDIPSEAELRPDLWGAVRL